jgi:hypothetical protein
MTSTSGAVSTDWIGGLAALGFSAACFTSMVLTDVPDQADTDAAVRAFYAVSSHRIQAAVAVYVLGIAMVCLLVLLGRLVRRLGAAAPDSSAPQVALAAGAVYVGLSLAAGAAFAALAASVVLHLDASTSVDPGFARAASTLGDALLLLSAPIAASVFVGAVCLAARRTRTLPGWVTGPGIAVAVSLLAGAVWFPLLLLVAWTAGLGTALLLRPPPTRPPQTDNAATPEATGQANPTTRGR